MTKADVWTKESIITRIRVVGHSNYASTGNDIVCSAISTATIMTCNLLEKVISKRTSFNVKLDETNADIDIEIYESDDIVNKIMENLYESLTSISTQYPKYFTVNVLGQKL